MENLFKVEVQTLYSNPVGVKFTVYRYGNLILVSAYTYKIETLEYGTSYACALPYNCYGNATAITGNYGTCGHFILTDNTLSVYSTIKQAPLSNTFMGQLTTFLK